MINKQRRGDVSDIVQEHANDITREDSEGIAQEHLDNDLEDSLKNQFINENYPVPDQQFTGKGFRDIAGSDPLALHKSDVLDKDTKEKRDGDQE